MCVLNVPVWAFRRKDFYVRALNTMVQPLMNLIRSLLIPGTNLNLKTSTIMKKILFPIAMMATLLVAGCAKDNLVEQKPLQDGTTVLTAVAAPSVKTVLQDDKKVLWTNGDKINVSGVESAALELEEAAATATFRVGSVLSTPYKAVFPASIYKDENTVTLPAYQTYKAGSFAETASPMAAMSETSTLQFDHLCAVLKLTVNAGEDHNSIKYVDFYAKGGEQISGDFTLDYENLSLTGASTADADKKVRYNVSKTLGEEPFVMYIVVPAQKYKEGYTVKVIDREGHYMEQSKKSVQILDAGKVYELPQFDFVPTELGVEIAIASAEELVNFATAYNAGAYANQDLLTVTLSQDITFDAKTSEAYAATGGIGDETNNFNGVFDGKGFSIMSWNSTCPLFAYTGADAVIKDLTIDASCTLTANYADNSQYYGAFVGWHSGLLTDCHVNAALVASGNWGEAEPHIGALAGHVEIGAVENCTVNGDVTFDNTLITGGKTSYFGGAVGRVSNADGELKGISVKGNISLSAGSTYEKSEGNNDAYVNYGGIVGSLAGTCTDCNLTESGKTFFYGNKIGSDVYHNHFHTQNVGGIAGEIAKDGVVSNCNNYAKVTFCQYNGGVVGGDNKDISRYLYGGGIAGQISGELSNCTMYGSISNTSSCLVQYIGGVAGNVQATASVHHCATNEGTTVNAATIGIGYSQARDNKIGGIIGVTYSTDISNLTNNAGLSCSRMNNDDKATLSMGGIVGKIAATNGEIIGNGNIVNKAKIASTHDQYSILYTAIGGVIGEAMCSVTGVVNEGDAVYNIYNEDGGVYKNIYVGGVVGYANGNLTLTSAENKGTAVIKITKNTTKKHYNLCAGGVLGTNADDKAVALVRCVNSGSAAFTGAKNNTSENIKGRSIALGGIVGALTNGGSSISQCTNTGCLSNQPQNTEHGVWVLREAGGSNYIGGIAGYLEGEEGDLLEFTGCVNDRTMGTTDGVGNKDNAIYAYNGSSAGLVGGAKYADIKHSQCTTAISNDRYGVISGLVAALNLSNLEGCTLSNSNIGSASKNAVAYGGIAGYAYSSTVKDNTLIKLVFTGKGATNTGVLAGVCDENAEFTANTVDGSFSLDGYELPAPITLQSTMIGLGAPKTHYGTSLWTGTADL